MSKWQRFENWWGFKWLDGLEQWWARLRWVVIIGGVIIAAGGAMVARFEIVGAIFIVLGLVICAVGAAAWVKDRQGGEREDAQVKRRQKTARPSGVRAGGYKREQLPGWRGKHYSATEDGIGLSGLWLETFSSNGDKRQIYRCEVKRDEASTGLWDATSNKLVGSEPEDLQWVAHDKLLYPKDFKGAPSLPLPDGDYRVEWFAVRDQLGRQVVAFDRFEIFNGDLVDSPPESDIAEKQYGYSIGQWKDLPNYQCDDCAFATTDGRKTIEEHRAHKHQVMSAKPAATASPDQDFTWTNMAGYDDSQPALHSLHLRLAKIGDRWLRGIVCSVKSPSGSHHLSPKLVPANQGELRLLYPENFDAPQIEDGTYVVTWRSIAADDPTVIATRPIAVSQVVLSNFWKGHKPGLRVVLEESEAKEVVRSGNGLYLSDIQSGKLGE